MNIIEIKNLEKKYESGCGKSTLLNIIGLIEKFDSGSLKLFGKEIRNRSEFLKKDLIRYKIGYLFQNYALIDESTVNNNLLIGLKYTKHSESEKKKLIADALNKVGLSGFENKCIYKLSGGEQRVAIARIMLKPSELILADEPTGSLDPSNRDTILELIRKINSEGKTILMVSHDDYVVNTADRVIEL